LNQRLGSFQTESRAAIFLQYRQDCPLSLPINRSGFHTLKGGKTSPKSTKNQPFSQVSEIFLSFLSLSLHCSLRPPPFLPLSFHHRLHYQRSPELLTNWPTSSHRDSLSLFSFQPFSLLCKPFSSSSISRIRPPFP